MPASASLAGAGLAASALLLAGGTAGATPHTHGAPVNRPAPATAPTSSRTHGSCTTPGVAPAPPSTTTERLMWVRPHPTRLTAIWLPGLNAKKCAAKRTVSGRAFATRVAAAIEHAKAFPTGALPCPFDDNTSVQLYFGYAAGADEYADVALSGCRPISAPDRASRWLDNRVERALRPAAPVAWRSYFAG